MIKVWMDSHSQSKASISFRLRAFLKKRRRLEKGRKAKSVNGIKEARKWSI